MKVVLFIVSLIAAVGSYPAYASPVRIIPEPVSATQMPGSFRFTRDVRVYASGGAGVLLSMAQHELGCGTAADSSGRVVVLELGTVPGVENAEGYRLDVRPGKIRIVAPAAAGVFYGLQSLKQLINGGQVPCVQVIDYPRYGYRGMHLDVSRHFFDVAFIKRYLDILAAYKINIFHWHLADSHGWRLEIKQYPRLTSVGAWRADRRGIPMTIAGPTAPGEAATYGGFYTQDQIREIVAYAAGRFITVVPEIEMPGHCTAALVAYPQFSDLNNPTPLLMPTGYGGDLMHNFCVGYDSTFVFLQNILDETMQLFPGPWIHIGGDEVRDGPWKTCPRCQQRMKDEHLTTPKQLQAWFTGRIDSFVTARGRTMVGWDEIRNAKKMDGRTVVMSWHGDPSGTDSGGVAHDVIMTPYRYTYFDFYQSDPRLEPDITYAPLYLDSVYAFDPAKGDHILGGEACLWTENVPTPARVEYMLLPRLLALSEALWTPAGKKDYARFVHGVEAQYGRWEAQHLHYARSLYNPGIHPVFDTTRHTLSVRLSAQVPYDTIRYTMNGTVPGVDAAVYTGPVAIRQSGVLKTAVFGGGQRMGLVNTDSFALHKAIGTLGGDMGRLTDGIFGTVEPYDGRWTGMHDSINEIRIDLGGSKELHSVLIRMMEDQVGNIYLPKRVEVSWSADGQVFTPWVEQGYPTIPAQLLRHVEVFHKKGAVVNARFVRVRLANAGLWKEPEKNQLFLDEIVIK